MIGHWSTPIETKIEGGFEQATFEVSPEAVRHMMERAARIGREEEEVNRTLASWYGFTPKPDARDIAGKKLVFNKDTNRVKVTLTIRRGHYELARLIREHEEVTITREGKVTCSCHPGVVVWVLPGAMPNYNLTPYPFWESEDYGE